MRRSSACLLASITATVLAPATVRADDPGEAFFEKQIRPALVEHCYKCHSAAAKKLGGGLLLDSRDGVRRGGESGKAIEPGRPEDSLLIKAVRYSDDSIKMPPKGKLPASVVADLEAWVRDGATDPRDAPARAEFAESWAETMRRRGDWWSLKPVRAPLVPRPKDGNWSEQPVDRFILSRLEAQGLAPAGPADPLTLARRLGLVLTGLPPTPDQVERFLAEAGGGQGQGAASQQAVTRLVDSLLASPHFGERWARHWMDVVRFSETHGNEWNYEVHHAWRYRDYLIRAFNADVPYDQFVREHIAGDLLPCPRRDEREGFNESIIGTGFYRFGEANHDDCIGLRQIGYDIADNQIDTLTKAFQATTVACARCHDHKLDAVSMDDYYALLGVVRSSRMVSHSIDAPSVDAPARQRLGGLKAELRKEVAGTWLGETRLFARYMQAACAKRAGRPDADELAAGLDAPRLGRWVAILAAEALPPDDPFEPWRALSSADGAKFLAAWRASAGRFAKEDRERAEFNRTRFIVIADFRGGGDAGWQVGGRGFLEAPGRSGDFVIHSDGDAVVRAVLPAGRFTHALSDRFNGTLRSPVLPPGKAYISFQVRGRHSSAVRLVSNNCQLNYKNYHALTSDDLQWVTFAPPADRVGLRTYAELMTMFDNPKFPDQLSALGGDVANYKLPWEKAAEDPRSYFGITRVVIHDAPEPPKPELSHLRRLFAGDEPKSLDDVTARYASAAESVARAWADDDADDDDVRWLDSLLRRGLLGNALSESPRRESLVNEYRRIESGLPLPRVIAGVSDGGPGVEQPVFARGDCTRPGGTVPRRYLEVLSGTRGRFTGPGSGRLELAGRIASAENPLTARVMVNRVWHHLFGTGLVRSVDDFGHAGEAPSHPELLDHLAARFVDEGWSVKRLIRSIVLTRTFQLSSRPSTEATELDPHGRYLQHYPARRMEAEAVRDSILATSGRLDRQMYGMSVQPARDKEYADRRLFPGPLDGDGRRSIYIKNNLMEAPRFLSAFDLPGGKVAQGRRDVTNVPAQALALLNDPFVLQQADAWAGRLLARGDDSVEDRLGAMFRAALGRPTTVEERDRLGRALLRLADLHDVPAADVLASRLVWKDVAHAILNFSEFLYIP
jgi:hypothetical protein